MKINVWDIKDDMPERIHGKEEFNDLVDDIKQNGLIEPIVLNKENKILAGRRRLRALRKLQYKELEKGKEFIIMQTRDKLHEFDIFLSENIKRKDLTDIEKGNFFEQRKVIYENLYPETKAGATGHNKGTKKDIAQGAKPRDRFTLDTAKTLNISERTVQEKLEAAKLVRKKPELAKLQSAKKIIKENNLQEQKKELNKNIAQIKLQKEYDVIVVDPPWEFNQTFDDKGNRGITPYPTMNHMQLSQIVIPAAKNCSLWLWVTNQRFREAFELLDKWGFEPKTILTWDKVNMGLGRFLRNVTEHCILAFKGKPYFNNKKWTTLISEKRTTHSTKPEIFYKMVDEICAGKKLDYFARKKREGWDVYGDEVK